MKLIDSTIPMVKHGINVIIMPESFMQAYNKTNNSNDSKKNEIYKDPFILQRILKQIALYQSQALQKQVIYCDIFGEDTAKDWQNDVNPFVLGMIDDSNNNNSNDNNNNNDINLIDDFNHNLENNIDIDDSKNNSNDSNDILNDDQIPYEFNSFQSLSQNRKPDNITIVSCDQNDPLWMQWQTAITATSLSQNIAINDNANMGIFHSFFLL